MTYETLLMTEIPHGINIVLNRVADRNTLNRLLMSELHSLLDQIENNDSYRVVIFKSQSGLFCTGMDFKEIAHSFPKKKEAIDWSSKYMALLKRFTVSKKIIISVVDGQVIAGGIGLIAASDLVIATPRSQFGLPEVLWGLLPANVLPYLIRRIGFQKAYMMTLTTQTLSAGEAEKIHLVDEMSDYPEEILHKMILRFNRLHEQTIFDLKQYVRKLWIIHHDIEEVAIHELARLIEEPRIQNNIKRYIEKGKFPWETPDV